MSFMSLSIGRFEIMSFENVCAFDQNGVVFIKSSAALIMLSGITFGASGPKLTSKEETVSAPSGPRYPDINSWNVGFPLDTF